jgi:hypothetical protein
MIDTREIEHSQGNTDGFSRKRKKFPSEELRMMDSGTCSVAAMFWAAGDSSITDSDAAAENPTALIFRLMTAVKETEVTATFTML